MQPIISFIEHSNSSKIQRLIFIFALIAICSFLHGCAEKGSNVQSTRDIINDTLIVNGKSVIFFSITNIEHDSLLKSGVTTSELDEALSDFHHYSKIVMDSLNKTGIKCSISSKPIYKIVNDNGEITIFSKTGKEQIVGAIMTDGKQNPKYHFGVATDVDYFSIISDYFNKK